MISVKDKLPKVGEVTRCSVNFYRHGIMVDWHGIRVDTEEIEAEYLGINNITGMPLWDIDTDDKSYADVICWERIISEKEISYSEEIKEAAIERTLKSYKFAKDDDYVPDTWLPKDRSKTLKENDSSKKEIKKKNIFYIAGPYRADTPRKILENIRAAEKVAMDIWKSGDIALCPHLNSRFMDGICSDEDFLEGAIELMKRCDGVFLVPGWEKSAGARAEVKIAEKMGLPVYGVYNDISKK